MNSVILKEKKKFLLRGQHRISWGHLFKLHDLACSHPPPPSFWYIYLQNAPVPLNSWDGVMQWVLRENGGAGSFTGMQQEWQFSTQICSAGSFHKGSQMGLCKASWGYEAKPRIHHCFSLAVLSDLVGIPLFLRSPNSLSFPPLPASGLPCSLTLRLGILWSPFVSDQASHSKRESVSIGPRKSTLVLKSVWSCLIKWASFPNTTL